MLGNVTFCRNTDFQNSKKRKHLQDTKCHNMAYMGEMIHDLIKTDVRLTRTVPCATMAVKIG